MNVIPRSIISIIALSAASYAAALTPGGSTIYAGLWANNSETPPYGIYTLGTSGAEFLMPDPKGAEIGFPVRSAWMADGKFCGYYVNESYSEVKRQCYIEVDATNGKVLTFNDLPIDRGYMFAATFNPDNLTIYGYGITQNYDYALLKAPASDPGDIQVVTTFDYTADLECLSFAYNTADKLLYGINVAGNFVKVDPATGKQTVVCAVPLKTEGMISGMCYAPKEGLFYWNALLADGSTAIYTISPDGKEFAKVYDCPDGAQYNFLVCADKSAADEAPGLPVVKEFGFANGTTSGTVILTMPSVTTGGSALTGTLSWKALVDGTLACEGTAQAGSDAEAVFTDVEEGKHIFTFYASSGDKEGEHATLEAYIGTDKPKAPAIVVLNHENIVWEAVTEGMNGGYVDADNIEYIVSLNGEVKFSTKELSYAHGLSNAELRRYTATVIAKSGKKTSDATSSNTAALGTPLEPGFSLEPVADDVDRMTVIDSNNDGRTWSYSMYQEAAKSSFGSGIAMDDWLVLSPVAFEGGKEYTLSFELQTCNASYPEEYMSVWIGSSPLAIAMTRQLMEAFKPERTNATFSCSFTPDTSGTFYIGFHTTSAPDQEGLLLRNINLAESGSSAVADIEAETAEAVYFNLQGIRAENPSKGIFIEKRGTKTRLVAFP